MVKVSMLPARRITRICSLFLAIACGISAAWGQTAESDPAVSDSVQANRTAASPLETNPTQANDVQSVRGKTVEASKETLNRRDFAFTGAGSCSAAGCHGGNGTRPKFSLASRSTENFSSHSTWIQVDPHARAYQVLLGDQSRQMHKLLGPTWKPPHQEARCLSCHATFEPDSVSNAVSLHSSPASQTDRIVLDHDRLTDGVSCESCHGPAGKWLKPHTEARWSSLTSLEKHELGFRELRFDLVVRSRTCVQCHVGGPGRDVNHDLIAAGHPRLAFEFSAYHANMPAHWSHDLDRRNFRPRDVGRPSDGKETPSIRESKLWLVGQLATAEAALGLLESRAAQAATESTAWPEFAEYSCYACHHDLQAPSWRQQLPLSGRKPGSYPWGTWVYPLLDACDTGEQPQATATPWSMPLQQLNTAMSRPLPRTDDVIKHARLARTAITQELALHNVTSSLSVDQVQSLLRRILKQGPEISGRDWDGAAQTYLATLSLYQGVQEARGRFPTETLTDIPADAVQQALENLRLKLSFPESAESETRINSPRNFDQERIDLIKMELRRIEKLLKQ